MTAARELSRRIEDGDCRVGIVGLGYVGLPLGMAFASRGIATTGFDIDSDKIAQLRDGQSYIQAVSSADLRKATDDGSFGATDDFGQLDELDALILCVPTPLDSTHQPDLRHVEATAETIAEHLRKGQLIVLESTTYPGTTEEVLCPILDQSGLVRGEEYFVAYSPERENPGGTLRASEIPKVVAGVDVSSGDLAEQLYAKIVASVVRVTDTRTAEAVKLTENVFRAVNIALVNELKVAFEALDVDIWEVLDAAETKPFGFMRFDPGPGWGGHCIPIDPLYLAWKTAQHGVEARFIRLAAAVNREMPQRVVDRVREELEKVDTPLEGARVLLVGIAYKRDVGDPRESPAFELLRLLGEARAKCQYHDPFLPKLPAMRSWPNLPTLESVDLTPATLSALDAAIVVTDHTAVDYELLLRHAPLVVDTRGRLRGQAPNLVRA